MTTRRDLLRAGAALCLTGGADALDATPDTARLATLRHETSRGGTVLLLRHARTEPGIGDPPGYRLGECATQRNLSNDGRLQAAEIGRALARAGVRIDAVRSSPWCRCIDTARLAFPNLPLEVEPALASFFDDRGAEARLTAAARAAIARVPATANWAFVTHMVNIAALAGANVAMGGGVLVRPRTDGRLQTVAEFAAPA